jgi:PBP1b-binding outer membrane lipoprotein LpoB
MKKLSIFAGLVFSTLFFASCEQNEIKPQGIYSEGITETIDLMEPEFATQKRPSVKTEETTISTVKTETISVVENKLEL